MTYSERESCTTRQTAVKLAALQKKINDLTLFSQDTVENQDQDHQKNLKKVEVEHKQKEAGANEGRGLPKSGIGLQRGTSSSINSKSLPLGKKT